MKGKIKQFFLDFKAFISRGNIIDMAVGVIVGGAFGKIVTSLVNDMLMPLIARLFGGTDMKGLYVILNPETATLATDPAAIVFNYGSFLQNVLDFIIIAFFVFIFVRMIMTLTNATKQLEKGLKKASSKETKALTKELKAQGFKGAALRAELARREAEILEKARIAAEEKAKQEAANQPPTTEQLLTEIRDLLRNQALGAIPPAVSQMIEESADDTQA